MLEEIISTLNGQFVETVGNLSFDKKGSIRNNANMTLSNNRNFIGYSLILSTRLG